jgi:dCTP deaminase
MRVPAPTAAAAPMSLTTEPGILVDRELAALIGSGIRTAPGAPPVEARQIQPASLDLRLGHEIATLRCGFLPERVGVEERLAELALTRGPWPAGGAVLKRGQIYVVPLEEELDLPPGVVARFNPRSSSGRCDLFCRVLVPGHPRFDETPPGYRGRLWLEVVPLSFPVRLDRGDRLVQLRLSVGEAALSREELREVYARTPLCFLGERALDLDEVRFDEQGALELRVGLDGRRPAGWRAALHTKVVEFAREAVHPTFEFWESVHAPTGSCVLDPGRFYIFASRERLRVPPDLAAEMLPVDVGFGELRNNYAGFFDNGFGWREDDAGRPVGNGTPAVLEVRAHDVPFLVEDGQVFFRLRFFRTRGRPQKLYGEGRVGSSYQGQDLTLARPFAPRPGSGGDVAGRPAPASDR